jgi:hypothetical protein
VCERARLKVSRRGWRVWGVREVVGRAGRERGRVVMVVVLRGVGVGFVMMRSRAGPGSGVAARGLLGRVASCREEGGTLGVLEGFIWASWGGGTCKGLMKALCAVSVLSP